MPNAKRSLLCLKLFQKRCKLATVPHGQPIHLKAAIRGCHTTQSPAQRMPHHSRQQWKVRLQRVTKGMQIPLSGECQYLVQHELSDDNAASHPWTASNVSETTSKGYFHAFRTQGQS